MDSVGRTLAHVLRRAARALHGLSARLDPAPTSAAAPAAVLVERFPGAPEHWLAYIAERAPHLVGRDEARPPRAPRSSVRQPAFQTRASGTPVEASLPPAPEPARRSRSWLRFLGADAAPARARPEPRIETPHPPTRTASLELARVEARPPTLQASAPRPATRPTPRPRLIFLDPAAARPGRQASVGSDAAAAASSPRPRLSVVAPRSALTADLNRSAPGAQAVREQPSWGRGQARAEAATDPAPGSAGAPNRAPAAEAPGWAIGERTRPTPAAAFVTAPAPRERSRPQVWPTTPGVSRADLRGDLFGRRRGFEATATAGDDDCDPWPALPESQPAEAPPAPPDMRRLRAEQDDGAWSA